MLSLKERLENNYWGNSNPMRVRELQSKSELSKKEKLRAIIQEAKHSALTHVLGKKQLGFIVKKIGIINHEEINEDCGHTKENFMIGSRCRKCKINYYEKYKL